MTTLIRDYDATALMQPACGFDSLSGNVKGTAVSGTLGQPIGGTEAVFSLYKVESAEDFIKSLNIDASVSLQVEFGKGGAKASFVSNLKMHDYSLYIAATVSVKTGTKILQTPTLDNQAAQLLTAATTQDQFRKMYGDVFLAGITQGGELIVFMEIQTHSQSDFENVDASIRGGDLLGLNQGSAHLQSSLQSIASNYQLTIHQFQRGGADLGGPLTPETVAAKASSFANTVTGNSVFDYLASFQTYDILPRPAGANPIQVDNQRQRLQQMGLYQLRYTQLLNSIEYVLFNPNQFEAFDDKALVQKQKELNDALSALTNAASRCFTDPVTQGNCDIPTLPDPVFPLPKRLDTTTIGAVQAAKDAAARTQGHAKACIESAQKVLEISQTIKTGPQGKAMVDQASLALRNAQDAYTLAQNALSDTLAVADLSDQVKQSKNSAESAVLEANDALGVASNQYPILHAIGYAPYWNAPTVINLEFVDLSQFENTTGSGFYSTDFTAEGPVQKLFSTPPLPIDAMQLVTDPTGGEVDFLQACDNPQIPPPIGGRQSDWTWCPPAGLKLRPQSYSGVGFYSRPNLHRKQFCFQIQSFSKDDRAQLAGKQFTVSIILVSKASGLRTQVTFQLLCFNGTTISDSYIQGSRIVNSGRSPLLRGKSQAESHQSLGWRSNPLVISRLTGQSEFRRGLE